MKRKTITIFGSSLPKPGEKDYEDAYLIGKTLAQNGLNICSGGAQGIMDAVSKGAIEENSEAIGVTVKIFKSPSSKYLTKEIKCDTLFERLDNLIKLADGFIILPGGTGTLVEISLIWELMNKQVLEKKTIACLGNLWKDLVAPMEERIKFEKREEGLVKCFETPAEVIKFILQEIL